MKRELRKELIGYGKENRAMVGIWANAICAAAPPGYVWIGCGVHEAVCGFGYDDEVNEAADALCTDMAPGIEPCSEGEGCEWCRGLGESHDNGYPEYETIIYNPTK